MKFWVAVLLVCAWLWLLASDVNAQVSPPVGGPNVVVTSPGLGVGACQAAVLNTTPQGNECALLVRILGEITSGGGSGGGMVQLDPVANVVRIDANQNTVKAVVEGPIPVTGNVDLTHGCPSSVAINQTTSTQVITGTTGQFLYVCSIVLISATAQNISIAEGTGSTCTTNTLALIGGSNGSTVPTMAVAANGGYSAPTSHPWLKSKVAADHICVLQSGSGNVSGVITYASKQ